MGKIPQSFKRIFVAGNYCNHSKNKPQLELDKSGSHLPSFLVDACKRLEEYYHCRDLLSELNYANGSSRQMRSERQEAIVLVVKSLLYYLDIASFIVGIPQTEKNTKKRGFAPLPLRVMQNLVSKLGKRRFERAIQDLKESGLLQVSKQVKKKLVGGDFQYFPCIRMFSVRLFLKLGFSQVRIDQEKKTATKRIKKKLQAIGVSITEAYKINMHRFGKPKSDKVLLQERDQKLLEFLTMCKQSGEWSEELQKIEDDVKQKMK